MSKKISDAYEGLKLDYYAKQRVWSNITAPQIKRKRRFVPAMAAMAAMAVVLAVIMIVHSFLPTQVVNSFTVRAYAIEPQADGTVARREINLANQTGAWGGLHDGENLYLGINLDVSGENIKSVEFSITDGFFAKQYHEAQDELLASDRPMSVQVPDGDGNLRTVVFGEEFVPLGQRISLDDIQAENLLLFVAIPGEVSNMLEYVYIDVHVVFTDGESQTETVALNFGNRIGLFIAKVAPDFALAPMDWSSINLNDLILIPESVTTLVPYDDVNDVWGDMEMYIWEVENRVPIFERRLTFEETDVKIQSIGRTDRNGDVIVTVVKLIDGDLVGMKYIVPPEIASEFGF